MKKLISIMLCVAMFLGALSSAIPSFALSYGDFAYEIIDGEVVITGYNGTSTQITIPAQIDGKSVAKIGDSAFKDNKMLTSIMVSEGVEDIGRSAFENCTALATISLPTTITHMGESAIKNTAFYNNKANWKLPKEDNGGLNVGGGSSTTIIPWEDIIAPGLEYLYLGTILVEIAFNGEYLVKDGTTVIADNALRTTKAAETIKLPQSIIAIGDSAFKDSVSLETIVLPQKDIIMSASTFYNTGYYNNPENWRENGLYYNDKLIGVKETSVSVAIKEGTTEIISGALLGKNIVIPDSVTKISESAFTHKDRVTIFANSGSYAEKYALANNIKFIAIENFEKCDLNFDGIIDEKDYEIIAQISTTKEAQTDLMTYLGDLDNDGAVDGFDAIILDLINNDMAPSNIKGDANGDGKIDYSDYDLLVEIVTTKDRVTDNVMLFRCDINRDGDVDSFDIIYLDLYLNNLKPII